MAVYRMQIDDFEVPEYILVGIHSPLEDYRLAYFLNLNLNILLEKEKEKVIINSKFGRAFFSKFAYENQELDMIWNLIQNKNEIIISSSNQSQDLFFANETTTETKIFLLPEFKNIDYVLKIDSPVYDFDISGVIKNISKIYDVTTTYEIEQNNIKSKNNLIF